MKNILFLIGLIAQTVFAANEPIDYRKANQTVAEMILNTVGGCGERIWPGYDLKNLNIVFYDSTSPELMALSMKENKIFSIKSSELPDRVSQGMYSFFSIGEQSWMSINNVENTDSDLPRTFEEIVNDTYRLAIHEGFHEAMQNQKDWKYGSGSRGTFVPIRWEPRYYRHMIYENLSSAYLNKADTLLSLQRAKYWFEKWKTEFPEEVESTTDGYEGSAQYVDMVAMGLVTISCKASESELHNYMINKMPEIFMGIDSAMQGFYFMLDSEGYVLGSMAALLLRKLNADPAWHNELAEATSPVEILLSNIEEKFEDVNEVTKIKFVETHYKEQKKVDEQLSETYKAISEDKKIFISIPNQWRTKKGSVRYRGFFDDIQKQINFSVLGQDMVFLSVDQMSRLETLKGVIALRLETNPCKNQGPWNYVFGQQEVQLEGINKISINSSKAKGALIGKVVQDEKRQSWFCAGEE